MSNLLNQEFYVYVLVRRDLLPVTQTIQCCHAAMESTRKHPPLDGIIPNVIVLEVADESQLLKSATKINKAGICYAVFAEPDRNNEATAIATEPITGNKRLHFKNYKLLQERKNHVD